MRALSLKSRAVVLIAALAVAFGAALLGIERLLRVGDPVRIVFFTHPPVGNFDAAEFVRSLGALVLTRGDEEYRGQVRANGYTGPITQYLSVNETTGPTGVLRSTDSCGSYPQFPADASGIAGDFCTALSGDERNFLHNGKGERLYVEYVWPDGSHEQPIAFYLMNPGAPGWRAYFVSQAAANLRAVRYDGLFLDNLDLSLDRALTKQVNSDGAVREYASSAEYRAAVVGLLADLRRSVGSPVPVWANMTSGNDEATDWDPYLPYLDGTLDETFATDWDGAYHTPAGWEARLTRAERVLGRGLRFLGVAQGAQNDLPRMRFGLASYLLIADATRTAFRYADYNRYGQAWQYDELRRGLGSALGGRTKAPNGTWRREFVCGTVTVDPAARVGAIERRRWLPGCA